MSQDSHLYIVYQGYAEKFRWRKVDSDGETVRSDNGNPITSELFDTQDQALEDCRLYDPRGQISVKRIANFTETIDEAEARQEGEAANG